MHLSRLEWDRWTRVPGNLNAGLQVTSPPVPPLSDTMFLLISLRQSTPPQNRQLIFISDSRQLVDDGGGVDFLKLINKYIL